MNPIRLLSELTNPETVVTLLAGLAAVAIIGVVWSAAIARDPLSDRAKSLTQRRETLRGDLLLAGRNQTRRQAALGFVNRVTNRLNLLRSQHAANVALKLAQAGWRSKDAVSIYLFLKLCLPFAFAGVAAFGVFGLGAFDLPLIARISVAMVAVVIGAYAPEVYVRNAATKRKQAIQKGLPDALDLLVICTEAGLALDGALTRVAGESEKSCPEISDELGLTAIELGFLPVRRTALENLIKRVDLPAMRGVVNTLLQTEKYGTPLAQSLRVLSAEFREARMLKAEEKAAKLPATLTVPLIVFIMPTLFIVLLGPAVLRALDGLGGL
ncbi:MAG: type II secretion system F family protein [Rhodospirillales bacterium]|nr:type II secretion system F family protein [Rhodospirillales bacterium]